MPKEFVKADSIPGRDARGMQIRVTWCGPSSETLMKFSGVLGNSRYNASKCVA